jgi:hypothetical protein
MGGASLANGLDLSPSETDVRFVPGVCLVELIAESDNGKDWREENAH